MKRRLLLISNSIQHGRGYLDHAETEIRDCIGASARVLFGPYALHDLDGYAATARQKFEVMGYHLDSIHCFDVPQNAVKGAQVLFIGGGNTFRLLKRLYDNNLLDVIRERVDQGMLYIGSSAGTVVTCPTIRTTNDMPIMEPPSLTSLGLIWFQMNCHYQDPDPDSTHMGETREVRLREYHEENDLPVVGLREGDMLRIQDGSVLLKGSKSARIFRRGQEPIEVTSGTSLDSYVGLRP